MKSQASYIGYIIPTLPRYSETFFFQDFRILRQMGYRVTVIPLYYQTSTLNALEFSQLKAPKPLSTKTFARSFQLATQFLKLFIMGSWSALWAFYQEEKKDETPYRKILAKIYTNAHFFRHPYYEVLVFGYGHQIVGRENLAKALGAQMVVGFQGSDLRVFPLNHDQAILQKGLKKLEAAFFRSNYLKDLAIQYGMPNSKPFQIFYNRIDTEFFRPKNRLGELSTPLRILAVGRLHWVKGFPHLLKAMAILESRRLNWELRIIGKGEEEEHLFYTAMELKILEKVYFGGSKSTGEVREAMTNADMFVNSSFSEGSNRALMEAKATGLLVITNNWEGADEIVLHRKTGWLVPKRDPSAIADQVDQIMNMPLEERKAVAKNAIQHVQQNFNLRDAPKDFEQLLK